MAKEKKEPLKKRNPYKYYRNAYWACQGGEWAAILTPMIILFGVKWNEYFDFTTNQGGAVKLTIGCILAMVCSVIFAYRKIKYQEKTEKKVTMLSYVIGVGVAFAFSYLFKVVIDDLFLILGCEFAGAVGAYGIDFATQEMRRKQIVYRDGKERVIAEDVAKRERKIDWL